MSVADHSSSMVVHAEKSASSPRIVARHACATKAGVIVERKPGREVAIIEDDGMGFDATAALRSGRIGLVGMRERLEMVGGSLYIESAPGQATSIFAEIPLPYFQP